MARRDKLLIPDIIIANNIKTLIAERNITQEQLASCCGKSRKAAMHWVNGYSNPSAMDIKNICLNYGISADELLGIRRQNGNS